MVELHRTLVRVHFEAIVNGFRTGAAWLCVDGVPPDAKLVDVFLDHLRSQVCFVLEHPSFPLARPGEFILERATPVFMDMAVAIAEVRKLLDEQKG